MKVIFLDIDGVLNHCADGEDLYFDALESETLPICKSNYRAFQKVLNAVPDAKIVWSSDWRLCDDEKWHFWQNPRLFIEQQLGDKIIGKTPRKMSSEHFHDIKWWLDANPTESYVILEDSYFPNDWFGLEKHLVRVNHATGLTDEDAEKAIEILARKAENEH